MRFTRLKDWGVNLIDSLELYIYSSE